MVGCLAIPAVEFLQLVSAGYNPLSAFEYVGDFYSPKPLLDYALSNGLVEHYEYRRVKSIRLTQKGSHYLEMS